MKIKIDENLASAHKLLLAQAGHDVADVHEEGLGGVSDTTLWQHVCAERRFCVSHAGILLVRTAHPSRNLVAAVLLRVLAETELDSLAGCLVVADEARTRTRKA